MRDKGFGYLQNSVWITPDPLAEERQILGGGKINVESLILLEAGPDHALRNDAVAKALLRWAAAERETWLDAVTKDPLLPGRILPSDYLGQQGWRLCNLASAI